ncbi:MAG: hypothetical protein ACJ71U_15535 [Terriglobales bacterium]
MNLLEQMYRLCGELINTGWDDVLQGIAGLNLKQKNPQDLAKELARPLQIKPNQRPSDLAASACRAVEPGKPAQSFLYHVLASPGFTSTRIQGYPTHDQLEVVENYIYGLAFPSIADLRQQAGGADLAIVVFVSEYRPGSQTVHRKHADMCFSRTGIARIGNEEALYWSKARGYTSQGTKNDQVRVVPCRYSAYISARLNGNTESFGPLRFHTKETAPDDSRADSDRKFWVPLHKLFNGDECIRNVKGLTLQFKHEHQNEKLRRLQLYLIDNQIKTEYHGEEINNYPFIVPEKMLAKVIPSGMGSVTVFPNPAPLIQEARKGSQRVGFYVPSDGEWGGAFRVPSRESGGRPAPEFIYVRQEINAKGNLENLNKNADVGFYVSKGQYKAQLYLDHTGDGWISAECPQLTTLVPQHYPAYSVFAGPDPYPAVKQQEVYEWWKRFSPPDIRSILFPKDASPNPPEPLSDTRVTANITYRRRITATTSTPVFDSSDDTYTTIVSMQGAGVDAQTSIDIFDDERVSPLPDGAAGLFAPGWDISIDFHDDENSPNGVLHLAAYGGGAPFLEDARLCAAQGGLWPAVAPDTARLYEPGTFKSVSPIPQSRLGWDGMPAPQLDMSKQLAVFSRLAYSDYILTALRQGSPRFDFPKIANVTAAQYELWSLLMARVYEALEFVSDEAKSKWSLVFFDEAQYAQKHWEKDEETVAHRLYDPYYFILIRPLCQKELHDKVEVTFKVFAKAFATERFVLFKKSTRPNWILREF